MNSPLSELTAGLKSLNDTSYSSIDKLMRRIMKKHGMTAKQLHNDFVNKYHKTPDDWIKAQMSSNKVSEAMNAAQQAAIAISMKKAGKKPKAIKEASSNCGAPKSAENKFHKQLDKIVHKTFGKRKEEMKIKEDHIAIAMGKMLDSEGAMVKNQIETIMRSCELLKAQIKSDDMQLPAWVQAKVTLATENILTCANYMAGRDEEVKEGLDIDTEDQAPYGKFDRRVNAAMAAKTPDLKIKLLKLAGQAYPSSQVKTAEEFMEACWKGYKKYPIDEMIDIAEPIVKAVSAISKVQKGIQTLGYKISGPKSDQEQPPTEPPTQSQTQSKNFQPEPSTSKSTNKDKEKPSETLKKVGDKAKSAVKTTVGGFTSMYAPRESYDTRQLLSFSDFRQINNNSISNEEMIEEKTPAWQRKEGQNPEGGLNAKGRASAKAQGMNLKAPSKEVGNPRRKSFCARMTGMKKKLTSKKTASDPDSRINKSLRAWNC